MPESLLTSREKYIIISMAGAVHAFLMHERVDELGDDKALDDNEVDEASKIFKKQLNQLNGNEAVE